MPAFYFRWKENCSWNVHSVLSLIVFRWSAWLLYKISLWHVVERKLILKHRFIFTEKDAQVQKRQMNSRQFLGRTETQSIERPTEWEGYGDRFEFPRKQDQYLTNLVCLSVLHTYLHNEAHDHKDFNNFSLIRCSRFWAVLKKNLGIWNCQVFLQLFARDSFWANSWFYEGGVFVSKGCQEFLSNSEHMQLLTSWRALTPSHQTAIVIHRL